MTEDLQSLTFVRAPREKKRSVARSNQKRVYELLRGGLSSDGKRWLPALRQRLFL